MNNDDDDDDDVGVVKEWIANNGRIRFVQQTTLPLVTAQPTANKHKKRKDSYTQIIPQIHKQL